MRRLAIGFLVLVSCSGSGDPVVDDAGTSDAKSDARTDSGPKESGADTGGGSDFVSTPGSVQCGSALTCPTMSFACCFTKQGTMTMVGCMDPGACPTGAMSEELGCDETPDCAMGELCCRNGPLTSCTMGSCGANTQLCAKNAECVTGSCKAYTCPVVGVVHACALPPGCL